MDILYIYDDPNGFVCTENWIQYGLEQLEHNVEQIGYKERPHEKAEDKDFVLFSKVRQCPYNFRQFLNNTSTTTVCWLFDLFFELPNGFVRSTNDPQFDADLVSTTDGGHDERWKSNGINHITLRQGIHKPEHFIYPEKKKYDKLFVGQNYYNQRRKLVDYLKRMDDVTFHHATQTYGIELNKLIGQAKVVVGDSYPTSNGYYWSNRVYEMIGRGGFLLMPEIDGLEEEFEPYEEFVPYKRGNFSQLEDIIRYYKENDDIRNEIRNAGFKKCGEYTYTERCKTLINKIKQYE